MKGRLPWPVAAALVAAPLLAVFIALAVGRIGIAPGDVLQSLATGGAAGEQTDIVVWTMRLPRILLAALVGRGFLLRDVSFRACLPIRLPHRTHSASQPGRLSVRRLPCCWEWGSWAYRRLPSFSAELPYCSRGWQGRARGEV